MSFINKCPDFAPVNAHLDYIQTLNPQKSYIPCGNEKVDAEVVSEHALKCFDDIQAKHSELKYLTLKRYTVVNGTYIAHFAIPISLAGSYVYFNGVNQTVRQVGTLIHGIGSALVKPLSETIGSLASNNPFWSSVGAFATTANEALGIVGNRPISRTLKWMAAGVAVAGFYYWLKVAENNKNMVYQDCILTEKDLRDAIKKNREGLLDHLIKTYARDADDLMESHHQIKHDPIQLYQLKQFIQTLEDKLPLIYAEFEKIGLSTSESSRILSRLSDSFKFILNTKLAPKSGTTPEIQEYNARLLLALPLSQNTCITAKALKHIDLAKNNELGVLHTATQCAASALYGAASAALVPLVTAAATFAHTPTYQATTAQVLSYANNGTIEGDWMLPAAAITGTAAVALTAGAGVGHKIASRYRAERQTCDTELKKQRALAREDVLNLYNGIAGYFKKQHELAKNDCSSKQDLKEQAAIMQKKLPAVQAEILKSGLKDLTPAEATQELQFVLATIADC